MSQTWKDMWISEVGKKNVIYKVSCHHERQKKKIMIEKNSFKSNEEPFRIDFTILSDFSVIILGGINECLAAK